MSLSREAALALLGLSGENPSEAEINAAYKAAMQMNHPDRYANNERLRRHAEEQSKLINEACDILLNGAWEREARSSYGAQAPGSSRGSWGCDSCGASTQNQGESNWQTGVKDGSKRANRGTNADSSSFHDGCDDGCRSASSEASNSSLFLDDWITPVGASVVGIVAQPSLLFVLEDAFSGAVWVVDLLEIAIMALSVAYAVIFYPSYFTRSPKLSSNDSVAFWNCAFGGIVFGLIWNANLTKKTKGKSYVVFAVLMVLRIVFFCVGLLAAVMYLSLR